MIPTSILPEIPLGTLAAAAEGVASGSASELPDDVIRFAVQVCQFARKWNRETETEFRKWMAFGALGDVLRETLGRYLTNAEPFVKSFERIRERFAKADLYGNPDRRSESSSQSSTASLPRLPPFRSL